MSLETEVNKVIVQGNDATTTFPYAFIIPDADYVVMTFTDGDGVQTVLSPSQYSITGIDDPDGGTFTYPLAGDPMTVGESLTLERVVPYTQPTVLTNQSNYYPDVVEGADDFIVMQTQQLAERIGAALQFPAVDPAANAVAILPPWQSRADGYLYFDSDGNVAITVGTATSPVSPAMDPVVAAATIAIAQGLLGITPTSPIFAAGACRVTYGSTTTLFLSPYNGNGLVIEDTQRTIAPDEGPGSILFSNSGLTVSTRYNLYIYWDGDEIQPEISTQGHQTGSLGIEVKDNDDTRSYVGNAYISAAGTWVDYSVSSWFNHPNVIVGAVVASTSGTSVDIIGFPPNTTEITLTPALLSTNGTDALLVQIGDSGGIEATVYNGGGAGIGAPTIAAYTTAFGVGTEMVGARLYSGIITLVRQSVTAFTWCCGGNLSRETDGQTNLVSGSKSLSAAIDRARFTTAGGVNTFDAGSIGVSIKVSSPG